MKTKLIHLSCFLTALLAVIGWLAGGSTAGAETVIGTFRYADFDPQDGTTVLRPIQFCRVDIDRLKAENAELRATVKHLEDMLGMGPDKDAGPRKAEGPGLNLPTEKQIDGAIDYIERMYKKLQDKLKKLESAKPEKGTPL